MSLSSLLRLIRKNLKLVIALSVIAAVAVTAVSLTLPNQYSAATTIYVLSNSTGENPNSTSNDYSDLSAAQLMTNDVASIAKSDRVKSSVCTSLGMSSSEYAQYTADVTSSTTTRVITITITGPDPQTAADIANAYASSLADATQDVMSREAISIIDSASAPTSAVGPNRPLYTFFGFLIGLFAALAIIVIANTADTHIRSSKDVEQITDVSIIARFPEIKAGRGSKRGKDASQARDAILNAAKTLLANIRFMDVDKPVCTMVVTSSVPNEGKTFVTRNLAIAIATSGQTVLVVEADMRKRSMAGSLGVHGREGVFSVLSGRAELSQAVVCTNVPNLYFLDAEPHIPNPSDLLGSKRYAAFIAQASQLFDYVLFDTPPVGAFVDSAVLGARVDATLMVVREGLVKRTELTQAIEQNERVGANLAGIVMNYCEGSTSSYYYEKYSEDGR